MPVLLDLFCGAGGAAMGYHRAGWDVVGVDLRAQPRYPFRFIQADAMTFPLGGFDAIHASPPCQAYSRTRRFGDAVGKGAPDLIARVRARLEAAGVPWVIENVEGAPMARLLLLCGAMFGLRSYRHRVFESSELLWQVPHGRHRVRAVRDSAETRKTTAPIRVYGHIAREIGSACMGIDWMTGRELAEAIPPAFTEYIGRQLLASVTMDTCDEHSRRPWTEARVQYGLKTARHRQDDANVAT